MFYTCLHNIAIIQPNDYPVPSFITMEIIFNFVIESQRFAQSLYVKIEQIGYQYTTLFTSNGTRDLYTSVKYASGHVSVLGIVFRSC